ncbi:hypothetical protein ACLKA6_010328 [Drosophila palustris]
MRQQLAILLLACLAFELSQAWLVKLPKLDELVEKLEDKRDKDLKKLDFLNLFADKKEKKLNEWEKLKEWFEEKKLKELDLFEAKKEKKKPGKKNKPKTRTTVDCYDEVATTTEASYEPEKYYSEENEEEEEREQEAEQVVSKPQPCDCKSNNYHSRVATAYDVREDYEDGIRYFT